ncbi:MAG: Stp1/IreP family PP2C-type Ser/Thr phosphatase [Deltaproteobacteria bacterium]|nr:MAG: Stp1/IreP family PP2C-type Ser/Thr phosphatase [Deltaproteobacteria bacterium]
MKVEYFGLTDVGRKREKNEDSLFVSGELGLFMVADGMGGHLGGEFASRIAVKTISETIEQLLKDPEATLSLNLGFDRSDYGEMLKYAIRVASYRIFEEASKNPNLRGMGTTTVALLIQNGKGYIAHVGDSRTYLVHEKSIKQLTNDHSLVAEQLRAGFITQDEVKNHKFRNIITRSVGFQSEVEIDLLVRDIESGDRFVLCSDGLTNMVENQDIEKLTSKSDPKTACQELISLANKNGGDDNISVVIVNIEEN